MKLDAGIYKLGTFIEGGDAGDGAEFKLIDEEDTTDYEMYGFDKDSKAQTI